jgi:hypothetical protein
MGNLLLKYSPIYGDEVENFIYDINIGGNGIERKGSFSVYA